MTAPFWGTLFSWLMLSVLAAVPVFAVFTAIFPTARGADSGIFAVISYAIVLPLTWRLFRK